jgi:DNA-binding NarL/FixJ family response regulator
VSIRVVIADDQGMVRAGFRSLLAHEPDIAVVGEATDGDAAVTLVRRTRPDVVLMDIRMPILDGLAATRRLMAEPTPPRVLILTTFDLDEYVYEALRAGAGGFLLKDATAEDLAAAIRTLAAGQAMLDPAVTRRVIETFARTTTPRPTDTAKLARLTDRETQVLRLIARGMSNAEIARTLVVSDATAKTHVSNVLTKLGLRDRVQGVIYAYETGLVEPGHDQTSPPR